MQVVEKRCCYCEKTLPTEAFAKNRARPDGLQARCRDCHRIAMEKSAKAREARGGVAKIIDHKGPRTCLTCGQTKPISEYHAHSPRSEVRKNHCKKCIADKAKEARVRNYESIISIERRSKAKHREQTRQRDREKYVALKKEVLEYLGGSCRRCGFSDERALQIDHVHGGGVKELTSHFGKRRHKYLKHVLEDRDGRYQLLCANCNWIKRHEMFEHPGSKKNRT